MKGSAKTKKLILGTAQFGLDYGVNNNSGQLALHEVKAVLKLASERGVRTLDTAAAYGNSEEQIGLALKESSTFNVISKFPPQIKHEALKYYFNKSLQNLNQTKLYGYLLHSYSTYKEAPESISILKDFKTQGLIDKIGVSLYHPYEAEILLNAGEPIDIVQIPYSVLDRRFEPLLPRLKEAQIETHARSVFLQGLYFIEAMNLPAYFKPVEAKLQKLQDLAKEFQLPLASVLLNYVIGNKEINHVVIGIDSLNMLKQNLSFCDTGVPVELLAELDKLEEQDEGIILPYNWPK